MFFFFCRRLYSAVELAHEGAQVKMKQLFDRQSEKHQFRPEDQVLAIVPLERSPFQAKFAGP